MQVFEQQTRFFKSSFFAGGINLHKHLCKGEDGCESIHNLGGNYAHIRMGPKKNRPAEQAAGTDLRPVASHQTFRRFVMVILQTPFVADNLTIEFVHQLIHGSVQIGM